MAAQSVQEPEPPEPGESCGVCGRDLDTEVYHLCRDCRWWFGQEGE